MKIKICNKCKGDGAICSQSGKPWNRCDCGWCERGPSTRIKCPICQGKEKQK